MVSGVSRRTGVGSGIGVSAPAPAPAPAAGVSSPPPPIIRAATLEEQHTIIPTPAIAATAAIVYLLLYPHIFI